MNRTGQKATLGGGCFWCLQAVFEDLRGVRGVVCGYAGGDTPDPTYEEVCTGITGHAEVVQVAFDPQVISYETVLSVFFHIHDPTSLNRQGNDVGTQYRSIILYDGNEQREAARKVMAEIVEHGVWTGELTTELKPFSKFFPAETYHQKYFQNNPALAYCQMVVAPKVKKFRNEFKNLLK